MATIDDILGTSGGDETKQKVVAHKKQPQNVDMPTTAANTTAYSPPAGAALAGSSNTPNENIFPATISTQATPPKNAKIGTLPHAPLSPATISTQATGPQGAAIGELPKPPRRKSYVELYHAFNPYRPETDDEKAAREKKEKREAIFSAIGGGISALANLYFTSRYAPNAYDPSTSMSAKTKERWDKLRALREAKDKEYFDGYLRALAMDDARDTQDRAYYHTLEREKKADALAEKEAQRKDALAALEVALKNNEITAAQYKAYQEGIKAQYAEDKAKLEQEYTRSGIRQRNAAAGASQASAAHSYAKAESVKNGGADARTLTVDGTTYTYKSKDDYERNVEKYAQKYGIKLYTVYEDGYEGSGNLRKKKYTTKRKSIAQLAAEVERKSQSDDFSQYEVDESEEDFSQFEKK